MSNPWDEMEAWVRERKQRALSEQATSEHNERFDRIEGALGELSTAVKKLVDKPAEPVPPGDGGNGGGSGAGTAEGDSKPAPLPPPNPEPELPLERVTKNDVPRIYNGDDEPETVTYIDADTGEEKTRPGRRKGQPSPFSVELVPDAGESASE